eukprot:NODE_5381_length_683_cov_16.023659_g5007_i0.p2 GENE.NODE_5381_length_683_cov_16.023659_g5007_i0~~NODE_5381_length_683_cov_16.023659_g5007_i0.p2  ORF type:complete len:131 (+),score=27.72 NODE_5381_length_683_cov_16.023659_g5007_i0:98-490(+)
MAMLRDREFRSQCRVMETSLLRKEIDQLEVENAAAKRALDALDTLIAQEQSPRAAIESDERADMVSLETDFLRELHFLALEEWTDLQEAALIAVEEEQYRLQHEQSCQRARADWKNQRRVAGERCHLLSG